MKSSLLILGDGPNFCEWFGLHASTRWPYVLVETARLGSLDTILEVFQPAKYRLLVVRMSFAPEHAESSYQTLTRLTSLDQHPPIVVIADDGHELHAEKHLKQRMVPAGRASAAIHFAFEVTVGGGDDAHIDLEGLAAADTFEFTFLQYAQ